MNFPNYKDLARKTPHCENRKYIQYRKGIEGVRVVIA